MPNGMSEISVDIPEMLEGVLDLGIMTPNCPIHPYLPYHPYQHHVHQDSHLHHTM